MSDATEAVIDTSAYDTQALALRKQLSAISPITSDAELQIVGSVFKDAAGNIKVLEAHMKPQIDEAHARHKKLTTLRNKLTAPFHAIKDDADKKLSAYRREQERIAAEARAKAEKEAQEAAEAKRLEEAEALEAQGNIEQASAVLDAPVIPEPVAPPPPIAKVDGLSGRKTYSAEVTDMVALCKAIGEGHANVELVQPNSTALNGMARALKHNLNIPGVKVIVKTTTSARGL